MEKSKRLYERINEYYNMFGNRAKTLEIEVTSREIWEEMNNYEVQSVEYKQLSKFDYEYEGSVFFMGALLKRRM